MQDKYVLCILHEDTLHVLAKHAATAHVYTAMLYSQAA